MTPPTKLKDLVERNFLFFANGYWFAAFPILVTLQHRLFLLLKVFRKSFDETKIIL